MVNKPKAIGTAAESAVVKYIKTLGYDALSVTRKTLSGNGDLGDVWWDYGHGKGLAVIEVKGGAAAKTASYLQLEKWLEEAVLEAWNSSQQVGGPILPLLVCQRAGIGLTNAGDWWLYMWKNQYTAIMGTAPAATVNYMVRLRLKDLAIEIAC